MTLGNRSASDLDLMKALDAEFRRLSGLRERRFYSIFYSRIQPAPLMLLGINPGGNPANWTMPAAADEFCSAWQHDYVDERYTIQAVMQPLLKRVLDIDDAILRRIPKTNMVFRRSQGVSAFQKQQGGMSLSEALFETKPVLEQIIRRVSPRAIIFEGQQALRMFVDAFGVAPLSESLVEPVTTPNGRYPAVIYAVHELRTAILPQPVLACMIGHPSKYAKRAEFKAVEQDLRERLRDIGAELREMGPPV